MGIFIRCQHCGFREDAKCSNCSSRDTCSTRVETLEQENKRLKEGLLTSGNAVLEKANQDLTQEIKILQSSLGLKEIEKSDLQAEIRALHTQLTEKENNSPFQTKINKLENRLEKTLNLVKSKLAK
jgi:ribosome-associated translation inhibitor RaiA